MTISSKNLRLNKIPKEFRSAVDLQLNEIAEKITKGRKSRDLSQEQLAELTNVATTTIQGIESGRTRPSIEVLISIVKALGIKITLS